MIPNLGAVNYPVSSMHQVELLLIYRYRYTPVPISGKTLSRLPITPIGGNLPSVA
jgi:hypothetical protein